MSLDAGILAILLVVALAFLAVIQADLNAIRRVAVGKAMEDANEVHGAYIRGVNDGRDLEREGQ